MVGKTLIKNRGNRSNPSESLLARLSRSVGVALGDDEECKGDGNNVITVPEPKGEGAWRLVDANPCKNGSVLIHGYGGRDRFAIAEWLKDLYGVDPLFLASKRPTVEDVRGYARQIDIAYIEAEAIGDAEDVVDFCLALRAAAPSLPLVLYTTGVAVSDFSTVRSVICDVTLKRPVSRTAVALSVESAFENNAHYTTSHPGDGPVNVVT